MPLIITSSRELQLAVHPTKVKWYLRSDVYQHVLDMSVQPVEIARQTRNVEIASFSATAVAAAATAAAAPATAACVPPPPPPPPAPAVRMGGRTYSSGGDSDESDSDESDFDESDFVG